MTSTPFTSDASGTDEHPEVAEISALSEGLLPVERQSDVRAHLDTCGLCTDVRLSLEEIRDALGTLPGPARMPEDVAGRIDAALAAEALLDATRTESTAEGDAGHGGDAAEEDGAADATTPGSAPEPLSPGPVSPAPVPVSVPLPDTEPEPAASPVSRETAPEGTPSAARGRRWRSLTLAAAAAVAVLGVGGLTLQLLSSSGGGDATAAKDAAPRSENGGKAAQRSGDAALRQRVQTLLEKEAPSAADTPSTPSPKRGSKSPEFDEKRSPSTGADTLHEDEATTTTVPSCVSAGIHRSESPLAVDDSATYEDRTGFLVVLPHKGGDPNRVDAYVVDPSCVSADPSGPGKVLLKRTYPRG
ncbi:hypothetical protein GCM10009801_47690 [Streptomyces albiaxialis]|uniref:Zinc-finger domain-containing protein n=1 Tax=Streptomyces albiaxialis TaxID=329523 RepID=A0ABP5HWC2_9ACTN